MRLSRKHRSRATSRRHLHPKNGRSRQRYYNYARVAFHAPEPQASLARNELVGQYAKVHDHMVRGLLQYMQERIGAHLSNNIIIYK